ncbi:MAG: hypothetical protein COA58_13930 [Bacteroidetes bacterium]|nr:MAG: hypothetical protein COA58_13930 [Bacteroidota bacterium]
MKFIIVTFALTTVFSNSYAQEIEESKSSKIRFGFNQGLTYSFLSSNGDLPSNTSKYEGLGYSLGAIAKIDMFSSISIVPELQLSFNGAGLERMELNSNKDYPFADVSVDFRTNLQYSIKNTNFYTSLGPQVRFIFDTEESPATKLATSPNFGGNVGIGYARKFKFFTMAPEIRYSSSFNSIKQYETAPAMRLQTIELVLSFY